MIEKKLLELSEELKIQLGISDVNEPIDDIFGLCEENDINILLTPIDRDRDFSGLYIPGEIPFIIVNTIHVLGRQYFTIAHELYHMMHENSPYTPKENITYENNEENADKFASYFLMPPETFDQKWNQSNKTTDDLIHLSQNFKVSFGAVVKTLRLRELIDNKAYTELKYLSGINYKARELNYSTKLYNETYTDKVISRRFVGFTEEAEKKLPLERYNKISELLEKSSKDLPF